MCRPLPNYPQRYNRLIAGFVEWSLSYSPLATLVIVNYNKLKLDTLRHIGILNLQETQKQLTSTFKGHQRFNGIHEVFGDDLLGSNQAVGYLRADSTIVLQYFAVGN